MSAGAANTERARAIYIVAALIGLKAILLAIDPTIRLYLGDSAAYLYGAMDRGRLPDDRSFTYSFIIRTLVYPFERLSLLGVWQTFAGVGTAIVLWLTLERRFAVPRALAAAAACLLALEPAQLYYERMVLAETFGLLAFVLFFATSAAYLSRRSWWWLPLTAAVGLMAATLRLNYLPIVLAISLALPLLPIVDRRGVALRSLVSHTAVALVAVTTLHGGYCYLVGELFGTPPGYLRRAGSMQLGLVLPLVKPVHLERVGLPPDLEKDLQFPFAPSARMSHLWEPGGLVPELRRRQLDVEAIARTLSRMAVADDPLGLVRLGLHTVGDYFREEGIEHALDNDLARRPIPADILWSLREEWGYDASGLATRVTLVSWAFERVVWWLIACLLLLVPLAALNLVVHWRTPLRLQAVLAVLFAVGLVVTHVLFVPVAFYRYLHPLPFFVLMSVLPLALGALRFAGIVTAGWRGSAMTVAAGPAAESSP
jgi:hypothetical protein